MVGCMPFLGWILQAKLLTNNVEARVRSQRQPPPQAHHVQALFLLDSTRAMLATAFWQLVSRPLERLVTRMLPTGMRVFAFEAPLDDMDGRLDTGVCLFLSGSSDEPGHVVCNVGHMPTADPEDLRTTVRSSLRIMEELHTGDGTCDYGTEGFVANLLCILPASRAVTPILGLSWQSVREVNLSVWKSKEAAAAWYRNSAAHAEVLHEHAAGGLKTFGNLLMSLDATKVSWQRRCGMCAAVVQGLHVDTCPRCEGRTFPMPAF